MEQTSVVSLFTPEFLDAARKEMAPKATDAQWVLFAQSCIQRNLVPGRHVIFGLRKVNTFNKELQQWVDEEKVAFITTIEAMTLIAERTEKYDGQRAAVWYYNTDTSTPGNEHGNIFINSKIPLGRICHAASVELLRKDWKEPIFGVARYDACVQRKKPKQGQTIGDPNSVWDKRGEEMTAKCARADAFRKGFPEEIGGLYIKEEMPEDTVQAVEHAPEPVTAVQPPAPLVVPAVNNLPASPNFVPAAPENRVAVVTDWAATGAHDAACNKVEQPTFQTIGGAEKLSASFFESPSPVFTPVLAQPTAAPAPVVAVPPTTPAEISPLPDPTKYKLLTTRITKIVRDVLQKAGIKDASDIMKAYLFRTTGTTDLKQITTVQWESILKQLESASNAPTVLKIIKS